MKFDAYLSQRLPQRQKARSSLNEDELFRKWLREIRLTCRIWGVTLLVLAVGAVIAGSGALCTGASGVGAALLVLGGFLGIVGLANVLSARLLASMDDTAESEPPSDESAPSADQDEKK